MTLLKVERLTFSDEAKRRYVIRRDDCGDEYIALRGKKALGNGGLDHTYLIGPITMGLWITSGAIKSTVRRLQDKVPDLRIEQLGQDEAVLSAPVSQLDTLCGAANARVRQQLSGEQKRALVEAGKGSRFRKETA